jgi:uncharacterized integral membrane protein
MKFLTGLFWFLVAVIVAVFIQGNWRNVEIHLWGGLIADINIPLLLLIFFLIGLLPMLLWHHATKWRLRQRLSAAERSIADLTAQTPAPITPPAEVFAPPPASVPTAVPPGGA